MSAGQELPRNLIVVGGASGIGEATAKAWVSKWQDEGPVPRVAICDYNIEKASELAAEINATLSGGDVVAAAHFIDVMSEESVDRVIAQVAQEFGSYGGVGYLVHTAGKIRDGLMLRRGKNTDEIERMSLEQWQEIIDIHLTGTFLVNRAVGEAMMLQGSGGSMVNLSSVSRHGNRGQSNYSAAKGGVVSFGSTVSRELAREGIRVNTIAPGFVKTPMTDPLGDKLDSVAQKVPLGRKLAVADQIAQAIIDMLLSTYTTGQVLDVDGGLNVGLPL